MRAFPSRSVPVVMLALLTGCAAPQQQAGTLSPSSVPPTSAETTSSPVSTTAGPPSISAAAGENLCERLRAALPDWRVQGPTLGKLALKGMAFEWAANNGYANIELLRDHTVFDTVAGEHCADTRQEVLSALSIPSLDAGIYAL